MNTNDNVDYKMPLLDVSVYPVQLPSNAYNDLIKLLDERKSQLESLKTKNAQLVEQNALLLSELDNAKKQITLLEEQTPK